MTAEELTKVFLTAINDAKNTVTLLCESIKVNRQTVYKIIAEAKEEASN